MANDSSERFVLLNHLADEFAGRYRHGERPSLQEYIDRHPELADDIREYFPALVEMEQVKDDRQEVSEPRAAGPLPPLERLGDFGVAFQVNVLEGEDFDAIAVFGQLERDGVLDALGRDVDFLEFFLAVLGYCGGHGGA